MNNQINASAPASNGAQHTPGNVTLFRHNRKRVPLEDCAFHSITRPAKDSTVLIRIGNHYIEMSRIEANRMAHEIRLTLSAMDTLGEKGTK